MFNKIERSVQHVRSGVIKVMETEIRERGMSVWVVGGCRGADGRFLLSGLLRRAR